MTVPGSTLIDETSSGTPSRTRWPTLELLAAAAIVALLLRPVLVRAFAVNVANFSGYVAVRPIGEHRAGQV